MHVFWLKRALIYQEDEISVDVFKTLSQLLKSIELSSFCSIQLLQFFNTCFSDPNVVLWTDVKCFDEGLLGFFVLITIKADH